MIDEKFIIFGAVLSFIGQISYLTNTIGGKVKPNKVTWFFWALIPLVAFAAEIKQGVGLVSLMTFMVGFGPLTIFIASFVNKKSYWKIHPLDIFCGFLSVSGLVMWFLTKNANLAIMFSIFADGTAGVPTVIKASIAPETESSTIFFLSGINALITLLAITIWDFAHYAFPLYIFFLCFLMVILIKFKAGKILSRIISKSK
ncbi:hypothetical protein A3D05_05255 [Candidatus Gottesmanbacteria bacterium RIFCSPHIGHO2_02_FULL_40_24]|uniref:Uncharacterized protein n=1 Tax=Candidatus Gottesmanbacteria bacterium RIFCSPHIGHO2_01_FULL_40_15 TaxID=1798376 RepID=A0A1F5Z7G6_9BACT|nr:MAG: hypothetical protein A2777_01890 [Candidatus Gottesmanbacteria bacterium RIFCSPHIGHO2_01_FULL_40_15]OGG16439.1 MAG: hypothetical protein A3D05_05255 [Candidatus Gottesmanbacteria bacterium RIFCSPHIGHO2_02_FULL_40_24]OGG22720.1 MAG: hypothetical protein A3B48_02885 [Candidatus Gottesmanbacteria bacterium RIFCSPLOWO2_01_FULL_40_10]OGG25553.1 MAG: hypothetical protein A3E42_04405 [Candidatus Gottesmanbacteria bacterium RIFCSPHIGHO2_12_FULL_40_13]OGG32560.1 MAG: hypothetical protein A3I80_0